MRHAPCGFVAYFILYTISHLFVARTADIARFSFASYYGDNMVLQSSPYRSVIWGYSSLNDDILLTMPEVMNLTTVVSNGTWRFVLNPVADPGPYNITVQGNQGTISLRNVLFGDVWICSGQSNMQFSMGGVWNSSAEIEDSLKFHQVRLFVAGNVESFTPLYDLHTVDVPWTQPTTDAVTRFSAVCLYFAMNVYNRLHRPLGLVEAAWGGTTIETWSSPEVLSNCGSNLHQLTKPSTDAIGPRIRPDSHVPAAHCVLWNAMIHPLFNMTIYGVLWYQGESNAGMSRFYKCAFHELIADWRRKFSQSHGQTSPSFPFGFVQLGAWKPGDIISGFSSLRWQQTYGFGYVPNPAMESVFMAVAMDLPDFGCPFGEIHPRNKKDVGWRLAEAGLGVAYGMTDVFLHGPFPELIVAVENKFLLVDYKSQDIEIRNTSGFEVCCSPDVKSDRACSDIDPSWVKATLVDTKRRSLILSTENCGGNPATHIRYAWRESPCETKKCAVYGMESDLPANPFILPIPFLTPATLGSIENCVEHTSKDTCRIP